MNSNRKCFYTATCPALQAGINTEPVTDSMMDSEVGATYKYVCKDGYEPSSESLVTECLSTGKWSLAAPTCNPGKVCRN